MMPPLRLQALRNAAKPASAPTCAEALRGLFMATMEYFHARPDLAMPQHILILVRAMQDSRDNAPAMQSLTLLSALQSLSCDEIAEDRKVSRALAIARAALVTMEGA
jgi:hypothetical protein